MMLPAPIITLTTDYGDEGGYVGAVKGVICSICPQARIVDIAHHIVAHDIVQAAMALEAAAAYFPPGTIHLAVVDPTVGTGRRRIAALLENAYLVGPDNGIFSLVFRRLPPKRIISIENEKYMLSGPATTFDGRDIFAPTAAYIANGLDPAELGPDIEDPVPLDWPENVFTGGGLTGAVVSVDRFGNLITSIRRDEIPEGGFFIYRQDQRPEGSRTRTFVLSRQCAGNGRRLSGALWQCRVSRGCPAGILGERQTIR